MRVENSSGDREAFARSASPRKKFGLLRRTWHWVMTRELSVLLIFFVIISSLWTFVEIAEEVADGDTADFDRMILLSMRNANDLSDPIGPRWVEEIGRDFTALGGNAVLTLLTLAVVGFLMFEGKQRLAVVLIVATMGALAVSTVLKKSYDRDRPDLVPHGSVVYTASFPSGHSMLSASTYLTLGALLAQTQRRKRVKAYILSIAIFATMLVGLSRIYLGVHWPTDVLAGWAAGAGWASICWLLARWLQQKGKIEKEGESSSNE